MHIFQQVTVIHNNRQRRQRQTAQNVTVVTFWVDRYSIDPKCNQKLLHDCYISGRRCRPKMQQTAQNVTIVTLLHFWLQQGTHFSRLLVFSICRAPLDFLQNFPHVQLSLGALRNGLQFIDPFRVFRVVVEVKDIQRPRDFTQGLREKAREAFAF